MAAPGDFPPSQPTLEGIDKLIDIARQSYSYVVVDVGSRIDLMESTLFDESSTIYLITQVGISELRNSNRLINRYFSLRLRSLQIVLNRYTQKPFSSTTHRVAKALTRPANWKIPDDWATARRTENTGTPIALDNFADCECDSADGPGSLRHRRREKEKGLQPLQKIKPLPYRSTGIPLTPA